MYFYGNAIVCVTLAFLHSVSDWGVGMWRNARAELIQACLGTHFQYVQEFHFIFVGSIYLFLLERPLINKAPADSLLLSGAFHFTSIYI